MFGSSLQFSDHLNACIHGASRPLRIEYVWLFFAVLRPPECMHPWSLEASPGAILSALNGTVAPALERRLEEMAEHHGGQARVVIACYRL